MTADTTTRVFALASHDLLVALAARESFAHLDTFAKRRAPAYIEATVDPGAESYWPGIAAALAPIAPPEAMPMAGLIGLGVTLEAGARGLRGLFVKDPSEKERKRVLRIATLAARVMDLVAGADEKRTDDEQRHIAMAMASFGLREDELAQAQPTGALTVDQFELHGDVELRVRREILRGAWQLALGDGLDDREATLLATLAAKLDLSNEAATIHAEAERVHGRQGQTAALAVELTRAAAATLPAEDRNALVERLIRAVAPASRAAALRARTADAAPVSFDGLDALPLPQRLQALALAWAALTGSDPRYSLGMHLRGELTAAAAEAGAAYETTQAFEEVERFLHQRLREVALHAAAPAADAHP